MDKIVGFSKTDDFALYYKEKTGSTTFDDKFIHLLLPYYFDDIHSQWKSFHNKYKRLTYMGRCTKWKDPERIIDICPTLAKHRFECEMRSILKTIAVVKFKDLIYNYGTKAFKHLNDIVRFRHKFSHVFIYDFTLIVFAHLFGLHYARANSCHLRTVVGVDNRGYNVTTKSGTNLVEQIVVVLFVLLIVKVANLKSRTVGSQTAGER